VDRPRLAPEMWIDVPRPKPGFVVVVSLVEHGGGVAYASIIASREILEAGVLGSEQALGAQIVESIRKAGGVASDQGGALRVETPEHGERGED
jgi:hypothetical protein